MARLERGNTLVGVEQVRSWCGRPDTQVIVKPVIDLNTCVSADTDRVPVRIAEHVTLRDTTCVFPWCTRPARTCDKDHIQPPQPQWPDLHLQHRPTLQRPPPVEDPHPLDLHHPRPRHPLNRPGMSGDFISWRMKSWHVPRSTRVSSGSARSGW